MPAKDANYNGSDTAHLSDCAVYNEPAFPAGPCNCRRVMHQRLTSKCESCNGSGIDPKYRGVYVATLGQCEACGGITP